MGFKGPLQQPDSKRGRVANGGRLPIPIQEDITAPEGMSSAQAEIFARLVAQNRAASVPIRQIDADQYADLANAMLLREESADSRERLAWTRAISELRCELNIGPRNRARVGVRDVKKAEAVNPMAALIRMPGAVNE